MSKYTFLLSLIIFLFLSFFNISFASSDGINVNLNIPGSCNNNTICDSGEDYFNCPSDCTPPPPPPSSGGQIIGTYVTENIFKDLTVEVGYNNTTIRWESSIPTMANIKWGINPDYKDGVIRNANFLLKHSVIINNLSDGQTYYFSIESENLLRKTYLLDNQIFRTLSLPDTTPPTNPSNVKVESLNNGVTVTWQNPKDKDFDYVRVVRNLNEKKGYNNGQVVYEGSGLYFVDSKVKEGIQYFYSLFSRDRSGNYSSGVYTNIFHKSSGSNIFVFPPLTQIEDLNKNAVSPIKEYRDNVFYWLFWLLLLLLLIILYLIWRKIRRKNKERE